ncbi:triosephosphate isomerase, partial [Ascosphaera acerosa]
GGGDFDNRPPSSVPEEDEQEVEEVSPVRPGHLPAAPGWVDKALERVVDAHWWTPTWPGVELEYEAGLTKADIIEASKAIAWFSDAYIYAYMLLLCRSANLHRSGFFGVLQPAFMRYLVFPGEGENVAGMPGHAHAVETVSRCQVVFCPLNIDDNHWALVVVSPATRRIVLLDSVKPSKGAGSFMGAVEDWLVDQQVVSRPPGFRRLKNASIKQTNSYDCGVFVCAHAQIIMDAWDMEVKPRFTQRKIKSFRAHMAAEMRLCHLLPNVQSPQGEVKGGDEDEIVRWARGWPRVHFKGPASYFA